MNNIKAIYFDMDGTIADLYGYNNWLDYLQAENVTPYLNASPIVDMKQLEAILTLLKACNITIGVISWAAMNGSNNYSKETRKAKKQWLDRYLPCIDELHVIKYGTPKQKVAKVKNAILVDDNEDVRNSWERSGQKTIDASNSEEMMKELTKILAAMLNK